MSIQETFLKDLVTDKPLTSFLCHSSGEILHKPGDSFSLAHLTLMQECGISSVVAFSTLAEVEAFKRTTTRRAIKIDRIDAGQECPVTLVNAQDTTVIEAGEAVQQSVLADLAQKGISELYYQKDSQELHQFQYDKYISLLTSDMIEQVGEIRILEHPREQFERAEREKKEAGTKTFTDIINALVIPQSLLLANPAVDISMNKIKLSLNNTSQMRREIGTPAVKHNVKNIIKDRTPAQKKEWLERSSCWVEQLQEIFTSLKSNREVSFQQIEKIAKSLVNTFIEDSCLTLNLSNNRLDPSAELYAASHCVNVSILTTGMACTSGYGPQPLVEIALCALMHDVGHVMTYRPLFSKEKLDPEEQKKYDQHAILGVSLLKNITQAPISLVFSVLQHHEQVNGKGRILHCMAENIHDFAKMIAVADYFDIASTRTTPFKAMSALLGLGKSNVFDMLCMRALLETLSLYPLGSIFLVTNDIVCKVIGTNGSNFKQPMLKSLCRMEGGHLFELETMELVNCLNRSDIQIVRDVVHPIFKKDVMRGF